MKINTINMHDNCVEKCNIVVKGGKFHGFNPATSDIEGADFCFLAPGYKVVEENGVFVVMPE